MLAWQVLVHVVGHREEGSCAVAKVDIQKGHEGNPCSKDSAVQAQAPSRCQSADVFMEALRGFRSRK